jgi:hypothetical protein
VKGVNMSLNHKKENGEPNLIAPES